MPMSCRDPGNDRKESTMYEDMLETGVLEPVEHFARDRHVKWDDIEPLRGHIEKTYPQHTFGL